MSRRSGKDNQPPSLPPRLLDGEERGAKGRAAGSHWVDSQAGRPTKPRKPDYGALGFNSKQNYLAEATGAEGDRARAEFAARLAKNAADPRFQAFQKRLEEARELGAFVHPTAPADLPNERGISAVPSNYSVGNTSESRNTQYSGSSASDVVRRAGTQWVAAAAKIGRRLAAGVLSPAVRVAEVLEEKGILPVPQTVTVRFGAESGGATTPSEILDRDNVRMPLLPDPIKRAAPKGPAPN